MEKVFDHLKEAYNLLIAENGQGVDKPMPRRLASVIAILFKKEGKDFILSVRQQARVESRSTQPAPKRSGEPSSRRAERLARKETILGTAPDQVGARLKRLRRQEQKQVGRLVAELPVAVKQQVLDRAFKTKPEVVAAVSMSASHPTVKAPEGDKPLTTAEAQTAISLSGKVIGETYGEARLRLTLLGMGKTEEELDGRSATQMGNILKKALLTEGND